MKSIAKIFSAVAIVAIGMMSSCTESMVPEGGDYKNVSSDPAYFAINLGMGGNSATYAYVETAAGTAQEQLVDALYILLYSQAADTLVYRIQVMATNNNSGSLVNFNGAGASSEGTPSTSSVRSIGYQVVPADYYMVVMANPTAAMMTATNPAGTPEKLTDFLAVDNDVVTAIPTNDISIAPTVRFPMTNNRGPIAVAATDLKATQTLAEQSPVSVDLDRTVAKIEALLTPLTDFERGFTGNMIDNIAAGIILAYQNLTWDLDIINKLSYRLRGAANAYNGSPETPTTTRQNLYATDPNMSEVTVSGGAPYTDNFSAANINTAYVTAAKKALNVAPGTTMAYATENTLNLAVQADGTWETQATSVIVKLQLIPKHPSLTATSWTTGYYSVDGFVFTHAEAVNWVEGNQPIPSNAPSVVTLTNLKANAWFWNGTIAVAANPGNYTVSELGSGAGAVKLIFHYNSWNVYRIPIRHFDFYPNGQAQYGHFGVVRNNWYKVSINSISGPGDGSSDKFISADVTILPWLVRSQVEDL